MKFPYDLLPQFMKDIADYHKFLKQQRKMVLTDFFWNSAKLTLFCKQKYDRITKPEITNMVLGSSYGTYGWVTGSEDFNIALPSQDLRQTLYAYKKFSTELINLKNIIIFYGVFSQGWDNEKTGFFQTAICQKVFWGTPYRNNDLCAKYNFKGYENYIQKNYFKINKLIRNYQDDYIQLKRKAPLPKDFAKNVATGHLKNHNRTNVENIYLENLIKSANTNGHNVWIIIPPFKNEYKETLPVEKELFKEVYSIAEKYSNANLISFYNTNIFDETTDFEDYEHLNKNGAAKLTDIVHNQIKTLAFSK